MIAALGLLALLGAATPAPHASATIDATATIADLSTTDAAASPATSDATASASPATSGATIATASPATTSTTPAAATSDATASAPPATSDAIASASPDATASASPATSDAIASASPDATASASPATSDAIASASPDATATTSPAIATTTVTPDDPAALVLAVRRLASNARWQHDSRVLAACIAEAAAALARVPANDPAAAALHRYAGDCHLAADDWPAAEPHYLQILADAPHSPEVDPAIDGLIAGYLARADFAAAAPLLARRVAERPDRTGTLDDLRTLAEIQHALGRRAEARATLARIADRYTLRHPLAAAAFWSAMAWQRSDDERREFAAEFLARLPKRAPGPFPRTYEPDRLLVARAVIALVDWRRACPHRDLDLCVTVPPPARPRHDDDAAARTDFLAATRAHRVRRCDRWREPLVVRRRDPRAAAALATLAELVRRAPDIRFHGHAAVARSREFVDTVAAARLVLADHDLERQLVRRAPALDLAGRPDDPASAPTRRFMRALHDTDAALARLAPTYASLLESGPPRVRVLAAHRLAMIAGHTLDVLLTAPAAPRITAWADFLDHCTHIAAVAEDREHALRTARERCVAHARDLQPAGEVLAACEATLADHRRLWRIERRPEPTDVLRGVGVGSRRLPYADVPGEYTGAPGPHVDLAEPAAVGLQPFTLLHVDATPGNPPPQPHATIQP